MNSCAHCSTSASVTAPLPSRSLALPSRQLFMACVARPPRLGSSKLTSSDLAEVICTTFSGSASTPSEFWPSRLRVRTLEGRLQAVPVSSAFMKNFGRRPPFSLPSERVLPRSPAIPPEWQASNMMINLSALLPSGLAYWANSRLTMTLRSQVSNPSTQPPAFGSRQRVPCPEKYTRMRPPSVARAASLPSSAMMRSLVACSLKSSVTLPAGMPMATAISLALSRSFGTPNSGGISSSR